MDQQRKYPDATGDFSDLLGDIARASKLITRDVRRAGLGDILGAAGMENVSGDEVKRLDVLADEMFINVLERSGHLCAMASEENEGTIRIPDEFPKGKYVFIFDPLDGSSNIDANVSVGSIFSIYQRISPEGRGDLGDLLQPGVNQVCAGYIIYGSSTMFVYTTGFGTHGFTLDPTVGEYILSHENIRTPKRGRIFSVNEGNYNFWPERVRRYIDYLKEGGDGGRPYTARYIGSLVADFHRNLLYGGIFLYPEDEKNKDGKLRLLYEASPMAFLAEQAGGLATTGRGPVMEVEPTELHQRVPLIVGSEEDVRECLRFLRGELS
jgi:fructose-1,6-bisphosphatase I